MDMHSRLVNSVHDSVVIDVHPDETEVVIQTIKDMNEDLNSLVEKAYGVTMNVPLLLEAKLGDNWLDMSDV
jgi:DNA polymerase I-like protein with 3'-5' exonuclease and polymerase domains